MRLSVVDGMLYAAMVGLGETYFVADAVHLGASAFLVAIIVSLPLFVGSLGPLVMIALLRRAHRRRPLVVAGASLQAAALIALAALQLTGALTPPRLVIAACVYQFCGQGAGTAWSSWYGDLVPTAIRGRYFARRTRLVHLSIFTGLVAGGFVLHCLEGVVGSDGRHGGLGFAVIFAAAGCLRLVSCWMLWLSPEPAFRGLPRLVRLKRFARTVRGGHARRILLGAALVNTVVYVASPFFAPFMLEDLSFSYLEYMVATGTVVFFKVITLPLWGKAVDRSGARALFGFAALCASLVPLPWLWADGLGWVLLAQAYSGTSWGGYEVCLFASLLEVSFKGTRPWVFAVQSVGNGCGQLLGGLLGAALLSWNHDYRMVFAVSLGGRLLVSLLLSRALPRALPGARPAMRAASALVWRVIGFRANGGVTHRPVLEPGEAETPPTSRGPEGPPAVDGNGGATR